jgi:protoporphyrinogen oxidase
LDSKLKKSEKFIIIGAGVSGLTAARVLREAGHQSVVLEKNPSPGGLTRTIVVDGFCFDYTGHLLHLAKHKSPSEIPFAGLDDSDWQRIDRKAFCYIDGNLIPAPIQYNIAHLPSPYYALCVDSYNLRPVLSDRNNISFRNYLISGFGDYLSEIFLIPQNEKTYAIKLDDLSFRTGKRFFPCPDEDKIRKGMERKKITSSGYNSKFWYPTFGGIDILTDGLKRKLHNIKLLEEIIKIDVIQRKVRTSRGNEWGWDKLISTMPLKELCKCANDQELVELGKKLSNSSTIAFNFGMKGRLKKELEGVHWIYISDKSIPFYRVGFYSNISKAICPKDYSSIYVEVGKDSLELDKAEISTSLQNHVIRNLEDIGWIDPGSIICSAVHLIEFAYIHFSKNYDATVPLILNKLKSYDIFPLGRYGKWDYTSIEDCILDAISTVKNLI